MGTRHITKIIVDNKTKVQNYGQWDGYPTGQGVDIADFLQNNLNLELLKEKTRLLKFTTQKELNEAWSEAGSEESEETPSEGASNKFNTMNPHLGRDCGARILNLIQDGTYESKYSSFVRGKWTTITTTAEGYEIKSTLKCTDKSWCEYEYVINLDKQTVKIIVLGGSKVHKTFKFSEMTKEAMETLEKEWSEES